MVIDRSPRTDQNTTSKTSPSGCTVIWSPLNCLWFIVSLLCRLAGPAPVMPLAERSGSHVGSHIDRRTIRC